MVIESLINPGKAERKPWQMFFIGLIYASIAIILAMYIFEEYASIVIITLVVIASSHIMYLLIKLEERKDLYIADEKKLMKEHAQALSFFVFLFLGFVVAFAVWYVCLPSTVSEALFDLQIREISKVEHMLVSGDDFTGYATSSSIAIIVIFLNNLKVMAFCLFFSFLFGIGALFILTWNASILGVAIGNFVNNNLNQGFFFAFSTGLLRYLIHGIPEILGFFVAGLAGGIVSVAVIKHNLDFKQSKHILIDAFDLVLCSVIILFMAALIEVYVTPLIFA